jgi:hypothetical protein
MDEWLAYRTMAYVIEKGQDKVGHQIGLARLTRLLGIRAKAAA